MEGLKEIGIGGWSAISGFFLAVAGALGLKSNIKSLEKRLADHIKVASYKSEVDPQFKNIKENMQYTRTKVDSMDKKIDRILINSAKRRSADEDY